MGELIGQFDEAGAEEDVHDAMELLRGGTVQKHFEVDYASSQRIEGMIGSYVLERKSSLTRNYYRDEKIKGYNSVLKALQKAKPVSVSDATGKPVEVALSLTGQQIVDMKELLDRMPQEYGQPTFSDHLLIDRLVEIFPSVSEVRPIHSRIVFAIQKLTRQEV